MIGALLWPFRKALAWAGAAFVIIGGAWLAGRRDAKQAVKVETLKANAKAHERMNDADIGIGASDNERIERLKDFARRNSD